MAEPTQGDISTVLDQVGRAAATPVDRETYPVDLSRLAGHDRLVPRHDGGTTPALLVVCTPALQERLRRDHALLVAAPGLTRAQRSAHPGLTTVIELLALETGPWSGAASPVRHHLLDELRELVEANREEQLLTYLVPGSGPVATRPGTAVLRELADIRVSESLAHPDTEGSRESLLLAALRDYARHGGQD